MDESEWPVQGGREGGRLHAAQSSALPLMPVPPPFRNHGNDVVSVAELSRFLAEKAEEAGAYILTETVGQQAAGRRRRRARRAHGRQGPRQGRRAARGTSSRAPTCRPGDRAGRGRVGPPHRRGDRTSFDLAGRDPQGGRSASRRSGRSRSRSTASSTRSGWPLRKAREVARVRRAAGSTRWATTASRSASSSALDYTDATLLRPRHLQEFKTHPKVRKILEGGKRVAWGAKAIPEGGYWAMPQSSAAPGMVHRPATAAGWSTSPSSRASTTPCTPGSSRPRRSYRRSRRLDRTSGLRGDGARSR